MPATFRLPEKSATASIVLLLLIANGNAIAFGLALAGATDDISDQRVGRLGALYSVNAVFTSALSLAAAVTFIVWAVRSRRNVDAFGETRLEYSAAFPGYFIVPVLNLFVPLLAFQEIWRASDPSPALPRRLRRGSRIIYAWWTFFVLSSIAGLIPRLLAERDKSAAERGLVAPRHACAAVAAVLACIVVWRLLQRQKLHPRAQTTTPVAFAFFDELRPAGDAPIRVSARIHVLSSEEGGRRAPFTANYRPNHNFGAADNRNFFVGQVEVPAGEWVHPGETRELVISFLNVAGLAAQLAPGRQWRIQEGGKLVATAEVLAVLPPSPAE